MIKRLFVLILVVFCLAGCTPFQFGFNKKDDKKIEAAARRYSEVTDCDKQEALLIEEGFVEGANWAINEFLNDLLHPAEEIPEKERPVLVVYKHGGYSIEYWEPYNISGQVNYWTLDITQWLYVDDLFPKEGGEK